MKRFGLISVGAVVAVLMCFSLGYSQSITVKWDGGVPLDHHGNELGLGASMMVIFAESGIEQLPDANLSQPYFLTNTDVAASFESIFANPLSYVSSDSGYGITAFNRIYLNTTSYDIGTQLSVYLRVFDNIAYDSFDGNGNWDGTFMNGTTIADYGSNPDAQTFYFDMPIQTTIIAAGSPDELIFNISGMQANMGGLPGGTAVPEPSAMFLMAGGAMWLIGIIRKKRS